MRERHRHHIAEMNRAACRVHALTVNPDVTGRRKLCSRRPGAHDPRVPQPSVDALALRHQDGFNPSMRDRFGA
jgi:hypothetical protein